MIFEPEYNRSGLPRASKVSVCRDDFPMPLTWTSEQVIALSPDAKSTKNGKSLATLSKWSVLGHTSQFIWGECQGSGKKPYRTQIDLSEPAFRCSCPSRKFPCKHALGLFLLLTSNAEDFQKGEPPDWVLAWLEKRSQTRQQKTEKAEKAKADPAAQAKRKANREKKVQAGLAELDLWLNDLMRQGLANAQAQTYAVWEQPAARMVDAQAPGLARRLREMSSLCHQGKDWPQMMLMELGKLHLLIQGYQRIESLPPSVQAELRSQIGWTIKQDDLLTQVEGSDTVSDTWQVLGRRVIEEENLLTQRLWLEGATGRTALLLSFAYGSTPLDTSLMPGVSVKADLVFYPGLYPLRAIIKACQASLPLTTMSGVTIEAGLDRYGNAIAQNPWIETLPLLLEAVMPYHSDSDWWVVDSQNRQIPIAAQFAKGWELMALSGGSPIKLYGEWDGTAFLPLGLWVHDQFLGV